MRALIYCCAALLLVNVAVFLWPASDEIAPHVYVERADVNPHFLSLNKEVESKFYKPTSVLAKADATVLEVVDSSCYRLGPFMYQANYELAQAVLFNAQVDFQTSTRESQESLVYRVYLGPLATQAEVDDARVDLKRKKILDHFVRRLDDQGYIISLGIYTTDEAANTAVSLFDGKLDDVKMQQEELRLPESYWIHFALNEAEPIRQQLSTMDWGELAAKLGKYECLQD